MLRRQAAIWLDVGSREPWKTSRLGCDGHLLFSSFLHWRVSLRSRGQLPNFLLGPTHKLTEASV